MLQRWAPPLERPSFNRTLFFPRRAAGPPPPGAEARLVDVPWSALQAFVARVAPPAPA